MKRTPCRYHILYQRKQTLWFSDGLDGETYKKTFVIRFVFSNGFYWEIMNADGCGELTSLGDFGVRSKKLSECIFFALRMAEYGHTGCCCRLKQKLKDKGMWEEVIGDPKGEINET